MFRKTSRIQVAKYLTYIICFTCFLTGCATSPRAKNLHAEEITSLSWFIEDVAHGIHRDPRELIQPQSSSGLLHIITWIQSEENNELRSDTTRPSPKNTQQWPLHIRKRIAAWKIIKPGIRSAVITIDNTATLSLSDNGSALERKLYSNSIHEENRSRRTIDQFILQHSGLRARSKRAQQLHHALIAARIELDNEARSTTATTTPHEAHQ